VKTISVEEAAANFERCIREVEAGEEYIITRDGQAVARLVPVHIGFGPLDRDELYASARRPYDPGRR
jgi:prevent-host-death family protein